jgi:uncharacterized beta-barrel protein YwiB (DUF1934 family)
MEIKIRSLIEDLGDGGIAEGEPEINVSTLPVTFEKSDTGTVFKYSEEQGGTKIDTELYILNDGAVRLSRTGGIVFDVTMKEGEVCRTLYSIPPYSFDAEVLPRRVTVTNDNEKYDIRLVYSMTVGGAKKDVKMRISIR